MSVGIILCMVRRTITIPEDLVAQIQDAALPDESFSAAISRLARGSLEKPPLDYIGVVEGGAPDDSMRVEEILGEMLERHEREERSF